MILICWNLCQVRLRAQAGKNCFITNLKITILKIKYYFSRFDQMFFSNLPLRCHEHLGLMLSDLSPIFSSKVINVITVIVAQAGRGLKLKST